MLLFSSSKILNQICNNDLELEDFIGLSMVSKELHEHFAQSIDLYIRDDHGGMKCLSLGKAFLSLELLSANSYMREKIVQYSVKKYPKLDWLIQHPDCTLYPTIQSFWQVRNHFSTNYDRQVSSSLGSWINRHGYDPIRNWFPRETQFQLMIASPYIQVGSTAIVLATIGNYSEYTFELIRRRLALSGDTFDYQDVVAALGVPWYDPKKLILVLDSFLISSDEIFWNIICHGSSEPNNTLLSAFLEKPLVPQMGWTFHCPHRTSPTVFLSGTHIKSHPNFQKLLIKKTRINDFPKKLVTQLKRKYKFKMK